MGFDANELEDDYAYKGLAKYGIPDGHLPMPTTEEIRKFREQCHAAEESVTGIPIASLDGADETALADYDKRMARLSVDERDRIYVGNRDAVIEFCKGTPSREQIEALPMPQQVAFVQWTRGLLAPLF